MTLSVSSDLENVRSRTRWSETSCTSREPARRRIGAAISRIRPMSAPARAAANVEALATTIEAALRFQNGRLRYSDAILLELLSRPGRCRRFDGIAAAAGASVALRASRPCRHQ